MTTLTFLTIIRNDDYYIDFKDRVQRALDLNLMSLFNLKLLDKVEFLFVDWGSKVPLSRFIKIEKKFLKKIRFINIDEMTAKKNSSYKTNFFNHSLAWNVGIKNSKGKYILILGSDQFFDQTSWLNLINLCDKTDPKKKNFYLIPRKIIDPSLYQKSISNKNYLDLLSNFSSSLYPFRPHTYYLGGGFSNLFSKFNFLKFKGMPENQDPGTANDFELYLKSVSHNFKTINIANIAFSYKFPALQDSNRNKLIYSKNYRKMPEFGKKNNLKEWGNLKTKIKFSKPGILRNSETKKEMTFINKESIHNVNFYKLLLNLNYSFFSLKELKKTFLIIKLINISNIISYFEIGFENKTRIDLIGSSFKYLNILCYDYSIMNNSFGYLNRLIKSSIFFNISRYGKFIPLINNDIKNTLSTINNNKTDNLTNLFVFNKYDKNAKLILSKVNFLSSVKFTFFFSVDEKIKKNLKKKFLYNTREIKLDNKNFIFVNNKIDDNQFNKINNLLKAQYKKNYMLSYLKFFIHLNIKQLLMKVRSIFYSI